MRRELVERAIAGDRDAYAELVRTLIGRLYAVAFLILRNQAQAEDATQEALVAAWRDLSALRDPDRFDGWVHRILVRACHREAARGRRAGDVHVDVSTINLVQPDRSVDVVITDELERGFRRLDPDLRAVVVLRFYLDLPVPEVAEMLGIPVGTAKSRIHRATQMLRAALEADARTPEVLEGRSA
jgi:RNA polymerase sigma-70 factor (ECF subfamily)